MKGHLVGVATIAITLFVVSPLGAQLTGDRNQVWKRNPPQEEEWFGEVLASGDFDGDGYGDLAMASPHRDIGAATDAGAVIVFYGTASGLSAAGQQAFNEDNAGLEDTCESSDEFGFSLVVGDFDADGYDDLVIGVPGESFGSGGIVPAAGALHIVHGSASGLSTTGVQYLSKVALGFGYASGQRFAHAVSSGDFDGDSYDDLAIGVPGQDYLDREDVGAVHVVFGSSTGINTAGQQFWHESTFSMEGDAEPGDRFGAALTAGDFNGDGIDDLAVGVPDEDLGTQVVDAGAVHVLFGSAGTGLTPYDDLVLTQNDTTSNPAEEDDHFAEALSCGDFNDDGFSDLVVGVPSEDDYYSGGQQIGSKGRIHVLNGSASGLSGADEEMWHLDVPGVIGDRQFAGAYGRAFATGDFDGSGGVDLAIGVPYDYVNDTFESGSVSVLYAADTGGLTIDGNQLLYPGFAGIAGPPQGFAAFGYSAAAGDYDGDGISDLAIGVPFFEVNGTAEAGQVQILYGVRSLFMDSFEIGDTSAWSAAVGD